MVGVDHLAALPSPLSFSLVSAKMVQSRRLGDYERFSLARSESRLAPIVAFTALLPSESCPTSAHLLQAAATLLDRYPLLRCGITDKNTSTPSFVYREELKPQDVIASGSGGSHEEVLEAAIVAGQDFDIVNGPLWKIWSGEGGRVTLIVHHTVSDGTGTRNLFSLLLSLLRTPASVDSTTRPTSLPPTLEGTIDCKTPPFELIKTVFSAIVLPKLPAFLQPSPPPPTFLGPALLPPASQPTSLKLLCLPSSVVAGLKTAGKANGVNTLHPLIYTSALAVLSSLASSPSSADDGASSLVNIVGATPFSLRDPSLGHPAETSGNYVAGITVPHALPSLLSTSFWSAAQEYGATLSDPATKPAAAKRMGMLGLLSDMAGWVKEEAAKERYQETFEVSNLGVLPVTGWEEEGLEEVYWAQTASAFVSALELNVRPSPFPLSPLPLLLPIPFLLFPPISFTALRQLPPLTPSHPVARRRPQRLPHLLPLLPQGRHCRRNGRQILD